MNFKFKILALASILFLSSSQFSAFANALKGAEYRTKDAFTYGRFEVRMKSAGREGMLSSFFTYFDGTESDPWAAYKWNEIDLEIMGRYDDNVQFNTITLGQTSHVSHYPTSFSPHLDYHIYAFEWTPEYVAWFVDGAEVVRQTGGHILSITRPQKIMMNVWNPLYENWAGIINPASLPAFAYYDWVSYYAYTPGTGNYGTENNFTLNWTDDFDSMDSTRWEKGTHSFPGNGCDFIEENAVFKDGKLILCLTNSTNTGYTDITPPSVLWARTNSSDKITVAYSEEVNQSDAENISKYYITDSQVSIKNAKLLDDLKTVELGVSGINLSNSYLLIIYPIKDRASIPNTSNTQAKSLIVSKPLSFPIKINCAGPAALDYLPEVKWSPDTEYGSMDGTVRSYDSSLAINGTDEDIVYQTEMFWLAGYKVRVPDGNYDVKLMFAENYFDAPNARIFDVYLEHNKVVSNLDIYNLVGRNTALVKEIKNIQVNDGDLEIQFADKVDYGSINGIVITPTATKLDREEELGLNNFKVEQNYPNPFNGKTIINYSLQSAQTLSFQLFNVLGEQIFFKDLGYVSEGSHQYLLDTASLKDTPLTSGIYFYVFNASDRREIRKLVLLN